MLLRTPLYEKHAEAGAKMVPFAGYEMPVEYPTGLVAEHLAVRRKTGLFDVSHMGEFELKGKGAVSWLNRVFTNAFDSLKPGRVRYTVMTNDEGFCLDDLIVYCFSPEHFILVVNASNRDKDFTWLSARLDEGLSLEDVSDDFALLALQGPTSEVALARLLEGEMPKRYYSFVTDVKVAGFAVWVARTGYTGEHGYEIFASPADAPAIWDAFLALEDERGEKLVTACGLGARDTLRLEAGMPLYGHEMNEQITPLEAGLNFAVKLDKDFIGRDPLLKPSDRVRVGLRALDRGIAREHAEVFLDGEKIGETTSGTYAPYLEQAVAMALIDKKAAVPGTVVEVKVRKKLIRMEVTELPFYKAEKK